MSSLDELLNARPTRQVWHEVCLLLAELDEDRLAAVAPQVLSWPAQQRPMPDDWWDQWTTGDVRPHHSLAGVRHLGILRVAEDEHDEGEETGLDDAYFYHGATAVAAPSDLSWVALGAAAEWHHNGGDIVRWNTIEKDQLTWLLEGADYHDEPHDMQLSPDGRTVVTSVEGRLHAWSAETGDELWTLPECSGTDNNDVLDDEDEDYVRIGFSGNGCRVAIGTCVSGRVAVMETETGQVVLSVPVEQQAFGPVALDAEGQLLAHTSPEGRVVVREVDSGAVLVTIPTRLSRVNALAMAPDGTAVFTVGGMADDAAPAAQLLKIGPSRAVGELIRPTELPVEIDTNLSLAIFGTRAVWTDRGPYAFVTADKGSMLFDSTARTLWASPNHQIVSFTPDGRAMVTVDETIEAWFLTGLDIPE
ncbi:hypothetical protein VT50_0208760 [Streptomyces antioxidans]|uniref:Pyrrolo-quinoline quinone repeat domain-containing protein n=1 Tax=Streptomyces antioxidans TaxID=1507734 RepID=A0A1V4D9D2_9ACTN|nr:PQQ-binding-like beta-propeller repeat protein [Streptomyces antioxidans]OPF81747.1 hypothetical protein VT50_0208760 [Streptomyces antioxidans]